MLKYPLVCLRMFDEAVVSCSKMWSFIVIVLSVTSINISGLYVEKPGPRFPPTKGEIWPKPQYEKKQDIYFTFNPSHFKVKILGHTCDLLTNALQSQGFAQDLHAIVRANKKAKRNEANETQGVVSKHPHDPRHIGLLRRLKVILTAPCEAHPSFDMKENYNLTASDDGFTLYSDSVWGALRGIESYNQLFYYEEAFNEIRINRTSVYDFPRYPHRGLLLDTGRHFISVKNIMKTLDAMAMNKLNVFHWHIIDDQSFPYESEVFPQLSEQGAYHRSLVYSKQNIIDIIDYATSKGIRVIPEFDVPGHTRSWGVAYPDILTKCYQDGKLLGLGPMNPIYNGTYKIIRDLFAEVGQRFPDKYFHLGGDEVELACWSNNPQIQEYMKNQNIKSVSALHALFMQNVIPLLASNKKPIVWQEVFQNNVPLSKDTLVQVWKSEHDLVTVLAAGHLALYSSSWYLDHLASGGNFEDFYEADPENIVRNETLAKNIMGGEACMWGEVVDDTNVISRVWPRASAVAERLWSPKANAESFYYSFPNIVRYRLEEHTCRMIRRGVGAQPPSGPGYCITYP